MYKVRLHFISVSDKVSDYDVYIQGNDKGSITANGEQPFIKEYDGIEVDGELEISLESSDSEVYRCGIEIENGNEPEATPRPPLKNGEILFGREQQGNIIAESFDDYSIDSSKWLGDMGTLGVGDAPTTATNNGYAPISGKVLKFGKDTDAQLNFSEPINSGQVIFAADYAQSTHQKHVSLVDSSGNEVVGLDFSKDTKKCSNL